MNTFRIICCFLCCCLVMVSCKKSSEPDDVTPEGLTAEGWQVFSTKSYQTALDRFTEALALDQNYVDAYNGTGWANAKLNRLAASLSQFSTGLSKDPAHLEIKSGLAFVENAQKNYTQSNTRAQEVLQANPNWLFSRDQTISASDLQLLVAENYFALAMYDSSLAQVQILNPSFTADVMTIEGQAALAQEIERLRPIV